MSSYETCTYIRSVYKEKHSNYMAGQTQNFLGYWSSQTSRRLAHEGGNVVSPTHRPPLPNFSFLLEPESTPGSYCGWRDLCKKKSIDPIENRTHDLLPCRAVPQPTALPRNASSGYIALNYGLYFGKNFGVSSISERFRKLWRNEGIVQQFSDGTNAIQA